MHSEFYGPNVIRELMCQARPPIQYLVYCTPDPLNILLSYSARCMTYNLPTSLTNTRHMKIYKLPKTFQKRKENTLEGPLNAIGLDLPAE